MTETFGNKTHNQQPRRGGFIPRGDMRGGRGGRGGRGFGRGRGRGRGGSRFPRPSFQFNNDDVDYSPEAIEKRFAIFYHPEVTKDPWEHLEQILRQSILLTITTIDYQLLLFICGVHYV
ncbi:MAG: hypothetical protein EXX96DRAFT_622788 [Benjaminiella poitrasii]|nr:MAG: hypothetical protein EXX96DRAFT_622788 [Benjaminiella poitrasii]